MVPAVFVLHLNLVNVSGCSPISGAIPSFFLQKREKTTQVSGL